MKRLKSAPEFQPRPDAGHRSASQCRTAIHVSRSAPCACWRWHCCHDTTGGRRAYADARPCRFDQRRRLDHDRRTWSRRGDVAPSRQPAATRIAARGPGCERQCRGRPAHRPRTGTAAGLSGERRRRAQGRRRPYAAGMVGGRPGAGASLWPSVHASFYPPNTPAKGPRDYGGGYAVFDAIAAAKPDAMLWLGDNVYLQAPDFADPDAMAARYRRQRSFEPLQKLLTATAHVAIWDDHDYGPNNCRRNLPAEARPALELFSGATGRTPESGSARGPRDLRPGPLRRHRRIPARRPLVPRARSIAGRAGQDHAGYRAARLAHQALPRPRAPGQADRRRQPVPESLESPFEGGISLPPSSRLFSPGSARSGGSRGSYSSPATGISASCSGSSGPAPIRCTSSPPAR